jgi:hypothetical protein
MSVRPLGHLLARRRRRALIAPAAVVTLVAPVLASPAPKAPRGTAKAVTFHGTPTVGALYRGRTVTRHHCTASVVRSSTRDILITAAHCVTGSGAGYVFAPGYHDGVAPYGRWTVTATYLDPDWLSDQDPKKDFAFLVVAPQSRGGKRRQIQDVTGGNRLGVAPRAGQRVTVPAYPAGTDNDPVTCTVPVYYGGIYPAFDCDPYPSGSSGSPWIADSPLGPTVVGVIGGRNLGGCFTFTSYSSPLGAAALRVYRRAVRRDPDDQGDTAPVPQQHSGPGASGGSSALASC